MENLDEENPFGSSSGSLSQATSPTRSPASETPSNVFLSEPPSPPWSPSTAAPPFGDNQHEAGYGAGQVPGEQTTPTRPFPSGGAGRAGAGKEPKTDFCCVRDRWLHSGEDAEIQVNILLRSGVDDTEY